MPLDTFIPCYYKSYICSLDDINYLLALRTMIQEDELHSDGFRYPSVVFVKSKQQFNNETSFDFFEHPNSIEVQYHYNGKCQDQFYLSGPTDHVSFSFKIVPKETIHINLEEINTLVNRHQITLRGL